MLASALPDGYKQKYRRIVQEVELALEAKLAHQSLGSRFAIGSRGEIFSDLKIKIPQKHRHRRQYIQLSAVQAPLLADSIPRTRAHHA